MIPAAFDYVRPSTVDEAVQALAPSGRGREGAGAAGRACCRCCGCGWPRRPRWSTSGRVAELRGVREDGDALVIGAMTTHYDVQRDPLVAEHAALLAAATDTVADPQVRHRGTFGGALAHADPAGDLLAPGAGAGRARW